MIYIQHRVNTVNELKTLPLSYGIEIDVRYHENEIVLHHDPFNHHETNIETLEQLLSNWQNNGPIILNLKTEGIEEQCINLMSKYQIKEWFFLDMSMPLMVKYSFQKKIKNFNQDNLAVRFSEFEPIEYALAFQDKVTWIWVDCFNNFALDYSGYQKIKNANFKICLVSPELQGHSMDRIKEFKTMLSRMTIDAVCSKRPDLWIN